MVKDFEKWFRGRRIGVLLGGDSAERAISLKTGKAIFSSLKRQGFRVVAIDAKKSLPEALKKHKIDFAYLALHGTGGEDGCVQGLLEWLKIPYTGSGVLASAAAMDKKTSKRLFDEAKLPTAPWYSMNKPRPLTREEMTQPPPHCGGHPRGGMGSRIGYPVVVKPASQGSAVGVSIVKKEKDWPSGLMNAFRYDDTVIVEAFLDGPEVTVGILGNQALPIIEILPQHDRPFYDYHAKYAPGGSRHILPARISTAETSKITELALAACRTLGTKAVARVDFIVDRKLGPCLLEVNTIPGMTETSLLPEAARAAGFDFNQLVLKIAENSVGS
jgi:D-alanine-D-alanine ligase